jgi:tripartite-type tricarboxylate transporter receptor subunit TctC
MKPVVPPFTRRAGLRGLASLALAAAAGPLWAQGGRTTRILVGFPPGGGTDAIARLLAEHLKDELGAPGDRREQGRRRRSAGRAGAEDRGARRQTLFLSHDHTISILPQVVRNPGFDPAKRLRARGRLCHFRQRLALSGGTPAKSVDEYVAWVKGPGGGKGAVGIPAPASTPEFLVKVMGEKYKLDLVAAPYRGSAPMMADMLGNQIAAGVGSVPDFIENHKAGKLRIVGVLGEKRQAVLPDVPTFAELGLKGFEDLPYYGLFAPTGTPAATLTGLSSALAKVLAKPEVNGRLTAMGLTVGHMSRRAAGPARAGLHGQLGAHHPGQRLQAAMS